MSGTAKFNGVLGQLNSTTTSGPRRDCSRDRCAVLCRFVYRPSKRASACRSPILASSTPPLIWGTATSYLFPTSVQALQLDGSWHFGAITKVVLVQNGKLLHICYEDGSIEASVRWTTIKLVGVKVGDIVCLPLGAEVTVTSFATRGRVKADGGRLAVLLQNNVTGGRLGINPENSRPKDTPSIWWPSSPPQLQLSMSRDVSPHRVTIFQMLNGGN